MAKAPDLIGQTFGRLTVLSREYPNTSAKKARWRCSCTCGNQTVSVSGNLKSGQAISCGCAQRDAVRQLGISNLEDLTGQVFSRLTVIGRAAQNSSGKPAWKCLCSCGAIKSISASHLKKGDSTSCGCYNREISSKALFKHGLSRTPEYLRAKHKRKHQRDMLDPVKALALRVRQLISKSLKSSGVKKNSKTAQILGCTFMEFRAHIEKQFTPEMSWENFHLLELDHIIPMATAVTEQDVLRLNHYSNFTPLFKDDNRDKSDKIGYIVGSTEPNNGISYRVIKAAQEKLATQKTETTNCLQSVAI